MLFSEKVSLALPALLLIAFLPIWRKCTFRTIIIPYFRNLNLSSTTYFMKQSGKFDSSIVDNLPR